MTTDKDLKRLVRARMKKTGESYTSARAQITRKSPKAASKSEDKSAAGTSSSSYARLAGKSDAIIKEKTGLTWAEWVRSLDAHDAVTLPHPALAKLVHHEFKADMWWSQTVAVGYERIKGLRVVGQKRDGSYQATKSRTFNIPVEELFDAWADAGIRKKWLNETGIKIRTSKKPTSIRLGFPDGSIIAAGFLSKGDGKSSVAMEQSKLADQAAVKRVKEYWAEKFDALAKLVAP